MTKMLTNAVNTSLTQCNIWVILAVLSELDRYKRNAGRKVVQIDHQNVDIVTDYTNYREWLMNLQMQDHVSVLKNE